MGGGTERQVDEAEAQDAWLSALGFPRCETGRTPRWTKRTSRQQRNRRSSTAVAAPPAAEHPSGGKVVLPWGDRCGGRRSTHRRRRRLEDARPPTAGGGGKEHTAPGRRRHGRRAPRHGREADRGRYGGTCQGTRPRVPAAAPCVASRPAGRALTASAVPPAAPVSLHVSRKVEPRRRTLP